MRSGYVAIGDFKGEKKEKYYDVGRRK